MKQIHRRFTMAEIEVANIMLELPQLIFQSEFCPRFSFTWGLKRKRSRISKEGVTVVFAAASPPSLKLSPSPPPPPSLPHIFVDNTVGATPIEKVTLPPSSPVTPLFFSPSESDEKSRPSKKISRVYTLKRKREQLVGMVADFTNSNEFLKKDIQISGRLLNQLRTENLELKSKKQKVFLFPCYILLFVNLLFLIRWGIILV
ncbi:hypothetical protein HRI_005157200 [Hibiscus trionum]|uniref:Uncharacterized protein n=1 Tax=Hibiscus trionum TaxID=183268 RepID=A0A9W7JJE1_HIBTR|nr:hypothetical protein HRI_005157200 [Hibiscus trionum]